MHLNNSDPCAGPQNQARRELCADAFDELLQDSRLGTGFRSPKATIIRERGANEWSLAS